MKPKTSAKKTSKDTPKRVSASPSVERSKLIRVMIVDDHPLFRAGLRRVLELEKDLVVEAEAADGKEALTKAKSVKPQVILMDVNLPGMNGLQVTRELRQDREAASIIVLTAYHDDEQMLHALRAGASAYFPKDVDPIQLVKAIHDAAQGNYVVNEQVLGKPQVANWLLNQFEQMAATGERGEFAFQPLSTREMEILTCITNGQSNKEVAKKLGISRQTVKNHMTSILRKLAVNDRTQAAVYALRRGWIRLQDVNA